MKPFSIITIISFLYTTQLYAFNAETFTLTHSLTGHSVSGYRYTDGRRVKLVGETVLAASKNSKLAHGVEQDSENFLISLLTSDFFVHPKDTTPELRRVLFEHPYNIEKTIPKKFYLHEVSNHIIFIEQYFIENNLQVFYGSVDNELHQPVTISIEHFENRDISNTFNKIRVKLFFGKKALMAIRSEEPILTYNGLFHYPRSEEYTLNLGKYDIGEIILKSISILCSAYSMKITTPPAFPLFFLILAYML